MSLELHLPSPDQFLNKLLTPLVVKNAKQFFWLNAECCKTLQPRYQKAEMIAETVGYNFNCAISSIVTLAKKSCRQIYQKLEKRQKVPILLKIKKF